MTRPGRARQKQPRTRTKRGHPKIVPHEGHRVKALIVAEGIRLGALARAAKISQPQLSNHLRGIRADRNAQVAIWDAWTEMSGRTDVSLQQFWGSLLTARKAG